VSRAPDLAKLGVAEKDALILSLLPVVWQLEQALARIAELEAGNAELAARPCIGPVAMTLAAAA